MKDISLVEISLFRDKIENGKMRSWFFLCIVSLVLGCGSTSYDESLTDEPDFLHASMKNLTDIIVHDIFSPPVASRIYAYPSIAAYEVLCQRDSQYHSLADQLHDYEGVSAIPDGVDAHVAAIRAFNEIGRALIFSEDKMITFQEDLRKKWLDKGVSKSVLKKSYQYGDQIASEILAWADGDLYKQTRSYPKFFVDSGERGRWKPTPPDYMDGIEPHWKEIRTMVIDSSDQFVPEAPPEFDMTKGSDFYNEVMVVYDSVQALNEEKVAIASFWDCNPYVSHHQGHVMFATKKITPGGHWMGISKIAAVDNKADLMKSAETYMLTSIYLFDAFIACWDEKYRSNLIRPETVINEYVDEDWLPILQTPPFPEHTSGHSVISRAAARALTSIYGDSFSYKDDVEVEYGLPARNFGSFLEASSEAAISRLYGGIHYMPAITEGVKQGDGVADFISKNLAYKK